MFGAIVGDETGLAVGFPSLTEGLRVGEPELVKAVGKAVGTAVGSSVGHIVRHCFVCMLQNALGLQQSLFVVQPYPDSVLMH